MNEAFANAGATSTHLGTQRSFQDYKLFAVVIGTGVGVSAPSIKPDDVTSELEEDGNIYAGLASQPLNVSLGINTEWIIDRTRSYVKVGYFDLPEGSLAEGLAFNSLNLGLGMDYQILKARNLPLGILRWRGISLGSGLLFQQNETTVSLEISGSEMAT